MPSGESVEPLRSADDDDSDDLGGFSRGKRSYDDDEDEDGGWAINEDHSDRLWDSAEDSDDDDDVDTDATIVGEGEEDEEEEELSRFVQMTLDGMSRVQEGLRGVFTLQRRKSAGARRDSPAKQVTSA